MQYNIYTEKKHHIYIFILKTVKAELRSNSMKNMKLIKKKFFTKLLKGEEYETSEKTSLRVKRKVLASIT
jgi:histidinol phosphatase-like PHP family hydrolase